MKKTILSNSIKNTQEVGKNIAKKLKGGEIIFLSGILGAGKTELIRGIAKGLGIKSKVPSPTFNIFRVYDFRKKSKLYHFDCYRLKKYSDLVELGWEEIIADKNSIVVLEWPECVCDKNIAKIADKNILKIDIEISENNKRVIKITTYN